LKKTSHDFKQVIAHIEHQQHEKQSE